MITEMHDAKPSSVRIVSSRKVVFTFNLRDNENLRDPDVVRRSMAAYMLKFERVSHYAADYLGDDWLLLTVTGTVNLHTVDTYL